MKLVVRKPNHLRKQDYNLNSVFDQFFNDDFFFSTPKKSNRPLYNVLDKDDTLLIELAVPGLRKNDFEIKVEDDVLTIRAAREESKEEKTTEKVVRKEFGFQGFEQRFQLPETVDTEAINATYEAGILHVALPKKEEAKKQPARTIEIA